MSANSSAQRAPKPKATSSLVDAVSGYVDYQELLDLLTHLERASARMVLDKLDQVMEPGEDRAVVRRRLLDTLAWYRAEIIRWVSQSNTQESSDSTNASPPSDST
jgi:DNA polymerase III gamma/tau subunit